MESVTKGLIELVENKDVVASGRFASLKVVEIPDNIE